MGAIKCDSCGAVSDSRGAIIHCHACYEEATNMWTGNKKLDELRSKAAASGTGVIKVSIEELNEVGKATNDSTAIDLLRDIRTWDILQEIERRKIKLALPADLRKRVGEILRRAGL